VVDDAIVVIENIKRHMGEEHKGAHAATSAAMGEVTGAVVATSLVLIAVSSRSASSRAPPDASTSSSP